MNKERLIILLPILVILISTVTIRVAERILDVWAWIPWILVYWASIGFLTIWGSGKEVIKKWMTPPQGGWQANAHMLEDS